MKRTLTAEQIAKRDARRAVFRALVKQVANMPELQRVQLANKVGIVTVEGRELSLTNTMLVIMQNPTASIVGGFRQWIKAGRTVRKGEHGCMIWCPIGAKSESPVDKVEPTASETEAGESTRFIIGTIFDISQTDEIQAGSECNEAIIEHSGQLAVA